MSLKTTAIGHLNLPTSQVIMGKLGQAYGDKASALAKAAAQAEGAGAYGMAQDLHRGATGLKRASTAMKRLAEQSPGLDRLEIVETARQAKRQAKGGLALARLTKPSAGAVPESGATRLMAVRSRWMRALQALEGVRTKLKIDPKKPGESLNLWIDRLKGGVGSLSELSGGLASGRSSVPAALEEVKAIRRDPAFRDALDRAKAFQG